MEQTFTPAQYFFMTVIAGAAILYLGGLYLIMTDKYEAKKERRDNELR